MALNIGDIQDEILQHLKDSVPWRVEEQAIPDASTLKRDSAGRVVPYIAIQFGDIQRRGGGDTLVGVRTYDYEMPIYVQVVAPSTTVVRKIANNNVLDVMLGFKTKYTGEVRKRPGGAFWPITTSNAATEAYLFPVSFALTVQLNNK